MEQLEEQAQAALITKFEEEAKRKQAVADEAEEKKRMQRACSEFCVNDVSVKACVGADAILTRG